MNSKDNSLNLRLEDPNFVNAGNIHNNIINDNLPINSNKEQLKKKHKIIKKPKFKVFKRITNINIDSNFILDFKNP